LAPVLARLGEATERVRDLARELRPAALDELGLRPALDLLARGMSRRGRLAVEVEGSSGGRLEPEHELALYRVAQQALTNVVRHSRARRARVALRRAGRELTLEVRDDGVGFDPGTQPPGLGLVGMRERAQRLGGRLTVVSSPGCGTVVTAEVPAEPGT
jgi:signal transduction histidine kinase